MTTEFYSLINKIASGMLLNTTDMLFADCSTRRVLTKVVRRFMRIVYIITMFIKTNKIHKKSTPISPSILKALNTYSKAT